AERGDIVDADTEPGEIDGGVERVTAIAARKQAGLGSLGLLQLDHAFADAGYLAHDRIRVKKRDVTLACELAAQLILDVDPDDVVKGLLGGGETELERAVGDEVARPAGDDADDGWIRHPLDARGDVLAGDTVEGCNLFADGHRHAGHAEVT